MMELNKNQLEAIKSKDGNICVLAGPGTGKTTTLTHRYHYLVSERNVNYSKILAVTFTRKAATSMAEKIRELIGINVPDKYIKTLHALGNMIIRREVAKFSFPNSYSILTEDDTRSLLYEISNKLNLFVDKQITILDLIGEITKYKHDPESREYFGNKILNNNYKAKINFDNPDIFDAVEMYLEYQNQHHCIDYNDMIVGAIYILEHNEDAFNYWSSLFDYILVDEFQDLTKTDFELISILSNDRRNIFGVGDPDQNIFSFRGSDVNIFYDFYKDADFKYSLVENNRSSQNVLDGSHSLIVHNTRPVDNELISKVDHNEKINIVHCQKPDHEAIYISEKIKEITKSKSVNYNDIAIIFRAGQCSYKIQEELSVKKIPYQLYSDANFFKSNEVKTAMAYINFIIHHDDLSFKKIYNKPTRYISRIMMNNLSEYAKTNKCTLFEALKRTYDNPIYKGNFDSLIFLDEKFADMSPNDGDFSKWLITLLDESGYLKYILSLGDEDKSNNLNNLIRLATKFEPETEERDVAEQFLDSLLNMSDEDQNNDEDLNKVQLLSVHCAKGLEFKYVFIIDFNDSIIPSSKSETEEAIEEERRIAYVAITRTMNEVYLLESKGEDGSLSPSRFLSEINECTYLESKFSVDEVDDEDSDYQPGTHVYNSIHGHGIIEGYNVDSKTCTVKFVDEYMPKEISCEYLAKISSDIEGLKYDRNIAEMVMKESDGLFWPGDVVIHLNYGLGFVISVDSYTSKVKVQFKNISTQLEYKISPFVSYEAYKKKYYELERDKNND